MLSILPEIETGLVVAAIALYAHGFIALLFPLVLKRESGRLTFIFTMFIGFGLLCHILSLIIRWIWQGHIPFVSYYETVSFSCAFAVLAFLLVCWRIRKARVLGVVVVPLVFLMMASAVLSSMEKTDFGPSLQSWWLIVHVLFAILAFGCGVTAFGAAGLLLISGRSEATGSPNSRLPSQGILDDLSFRFMSLAFVLHSVMVVTGAIWARQAWGRLWGWDPIETGSLVTWIFYGIYLHLRVIFGWRERRAAWFAVASLLLLIYCYWGIPFVSPSVHLYNKP